MNSEYMSVLLPADVVAQLDQETDEAPDGPLAQYLQDDRRTLEGLGRVQVEGGGMSLRREGSKLYLDAQYEIPQLLSKSQEAALREFTRGQFSDGGGDSWLQQFWKKHPIRLAIQFEEITVKIEP